MNKMNKKVTAGLAVSALALLISNAVLFSKVTTLEENAVTKLEVAGLKDSVTEFETTLANQELTLSDNQFSDLMMNNPKIIVKSLAKFRFEQEQLAKQEANKKVGDLSVALYEDKNDPVLGNPNGKHVVVEFVDYNCGYCKKLSPTLEQFIKVDPEAKVIVKEYPIFTNQPTSAYSALMGTALFYSDAEKYAEYHKIVMSQRSLTKEGIDSILVTVGAPKTTLQAHLAKAKTQIEEVRTLGAKLNVTGTPTMFIGNERLNGISLGEIISRFN